MDSDRRSLVSLERRRTARQRGLRLLALVVLVLVPIGSGSLKVSGGAVRGHLDLFGQFMLSPVALLFPFIATLIGCGPLLIDLRHRGISATRARVDIRTYLDVRFRAMLVTVWSLFGISVLLVLVVAFAVWPLLGDPSVDPTIYGMSAESAAADAVGRFSYSELFAGGPIVFGLAYAAWFGLAAASYSALGFVALLLVPNTALALSLPIGLYLVQTVVVSFAGVPSLGLMPSVIPFGFSSVPLLEAASPTLMLMVTAFFASRLTLRIAPGLGTLS